ncbi:MAG: hypothetical protein ACE37K_19030 [Planctomycetota bacterium]
MIRARTRARRPTSDARRAARERCRALARGLELHPDDDRPVTDLTLPQTYQP